MGYNDPDPYNQPEYYGLETIGEIDWDEESYQFNLTVVWRHKETGALYIADDSGCSCPSPFEGLTSKDVNETLATLERVRDIAALRQALASRNPERDSYGVNRDHMRCQSEISVILDRLHELGVR